MKRFVVFAGGQYYPAGGWDDFHSDHDAKEEAVEAADRQIHELHDDWSHVVDTSVGEKIYSTSSLRVFNSRRDSETETP